MADPRQGRPPTQRGAISRLADRLAGGARDLAAGWMGPPGSVWGEGANAALAGARAILPGGGSFEDELLNVRDGREQDYPGAYSVVPELRRRALSQAMDDDALSQAIGMHGTTRLGKKLRAGEIGLPDLDRLPGELGVADFGAADASRGIGTHAQLARQGKAALREIEVPAPAAVARLEDRNSKLLTAAYRRGDARQTFNPMEGAGVTELMPDNTINIRINEAAMPRAEAFASQATGRAGRPAGRPFETPATLRKTILDHEFGEKDAFNGVLDGDPMFPFASHGDVKPDLAELYTSREHPALYEATEARFRGSPSPLENELARLNREFGGTAGRPIPPEGRQARGIRDRMLEKYADLATPTEQQRALLYRNYHGITVDPRIEAALRNRSNFYASSRAPAARPRRRVK